MDKRDTVLAKLAMALGLIDGAGLQRAMAALAQRPGTTFDKVLLETGAIDADGWKKLVGAFNEQVRAARGPSPAPAPAASPAPGVSPASAANRPPAGDAGLSQTPAGGVRPLPGRRPLARGLAARRPVGPARTPHQPAAPPPAAAGAAGPAPAAAHGAPALPPGWPAPPPGWQPGMPPPGWQTGMPPPQAWPAPPGWPAPPPGWPEGAAPPGWPAPPPGWPAPPPGWPAPGQAPPGWPQPPATAAPAAPAASAESPGSWVGAPSDWVPFGGAGSDEQDLDVPDEDEPNLVIPVEDSDTGLGSSDDVLDPVGASPLALPDEDDDVYAEPTLMIPSDPPIGRDDTPTAVDEEELFAEPTMVLREEPPTRARGHGAPGAGASGLGAVPPGGDDAPTNGDEEVFAEPTIVLTDAAGSKRSRGPAEDAPPSDQVFAEPTIVLADGAGQAAPAPGKPTHQFDLSLASSGRRKAADGPGELNQVEFQQRLKAKQDFKGFSVGDYKIVGELARGAFGVVLEVSPGGAAKTIARQRGIEGNLALKLMLENAADPREKERFLDEVRVLIGLDHPHVIKIFDAGGFNGLRFYAMELIKGVETRAHVKKTGPMPPLLAVRVVKEIASALSYVHAQRIFHRDLKPQNVMLDMACQPYRAVLIDFGLVSEQESAGKDKGLIMGTPNYMPPEQAAPKGGFGEVDASSDIYSLGATFYYLLTGEPPFTGRDPRLIIKQVVGQKPRDPLEINKTIPRRIADLCLKCLEKRQEDRFASSRQLEAELDKELRSGQRSLKAKAFLGRILGRPRGNEGGK